MGREFAGANRLGVWGNQFGMPGAPRLQVAGLKFYATDAYWWRRWWFKLRRETGLFRTIHNIVPLVNEANH